MMPSALIQLLQGLLKRVVVLACVSVWPLIGHPAVQVADVDNKPGILAASSLIGHLAVPVVDVDNRQGILGVSKILLLVVR
jgi:hypothetical protein